MLTKVIPTQCIRTLNVYYTKKSKQIWYPDETSPDETSCGFFVQKFCNETSLGQNGPWDKAVLGQNILEKFATKRPHFQGWTIRGAQFLDFQLVATGSRCKMLF
jgi:hypothetical protein